MTQGEETLAMRCARMRLCSFQETHLKHDACVIDADKRDYLRGGGHDLSDYQHEHSHGQKVGYDQSNTFARVGR